MYRWHFQFYTRRPDVRCFTYSIFLFRRLEITGEIFRPLPRNIKIFLEYAYYYKKRGGVF